MALWKRVICGVDGMIDMTKLEHKEYELTCIAPIHIGNGEVLRNFEYIYINNRGKYKAIFLDKTKWADFLIRNDLLDAYVSYVEQGKVALWDWLKRQTKIRNLDQQVKQLTDSTAMAYPHTDVKKTLNDVARQIKTVQGVPYIPGSSIKGALRSAILYYLIKQHPQSYQPIWQEVKQVIETHQGRKYKNNQLQYIANELENFAFTKLPNHGKRADNALQSVMKGIRVSDAMVTAGSKDTVIIQKMDNSKKRGEALHEHFISLFRECIPAGTMLRFSITMDKEIMDYINIHSLDELWEMSRKYVEDSVIMQKEIFGKVYQAEFKKAELADIFLGGGPGFLSKTAYYALAPKDEGKKILARYFDDIFTNTNRRTKQREPAHYHVRDDDKITPRTLKLAMTDNECWLMGIASVREIR